jgi:hypothetical protein
MYKSPILSYNRYKYEDARGYDIFSNEKKNNRNLADLRIKDKENHWEKLVNNVEGNFILFYFYYYYLYLLYLFTIIYM